MSSRLSNVRFPPTVQLNLAGTGHPEYLPRPQSSTDLQEGIRRDFIHLKKLKLEADPAGKTDT